MTVRCEFDGPIAVITPHRPEVCQAIDRPTADALVDAFRHIDTNESLQVAVLTGANSTFCAGADLKSMQEPGMAWASRVEPDGDGPVGRTRMLSTKPVIADVEGHPVAGGLELAAWCDLRVAATNAVFGVYCRRWGIPLMDRLSTMHKIPMLVSDPCLAALDRTNLAVRSHHFDDIQLRGAECRCYPKGRVLPARRGESMKVWIDQDLCTGDGLCEEIAPAVFTLLDDGLAYVKESDQVRSEPGGAAGMALVPEDLEEAVTEAAEECPGECIFIEQG